MTYFKKSIKIALRKSDNPTDLIPSNQHRRSQSSAFGTCPFGFGNGLRDLDTELLLAKCTSTVVTMITQKTYFVKCFSKF